MTTNKVGAIEATRAKLAADSKLAAVTSAFEHWLPASEALTAIRAVPTDFLQLDHAIRVGGWPTQRFGICHGPSNHGKTCLCLGIGKSFLRRGHIFGLIDAEMTTPFDWVTQLMGEYATSPGFVAKRPDSYEDTVLAVREFCQRLADARDEGIVNRDTSGLIVVDSLQKLTPQKLLDKLIDGEGGIDGASGRGGMMLAALHSQWLRELTPLLYHSNASMIVIVREYEKADAKPFEQKFKVAGGKAPLFDSSIALRVQRAGYVKEGKTRVIGERHKVTIYKTKVAAKEDKDQVCYFHTSNGNDMAVGFDPYRDLVELAIKLKVFKVKSNRLIWAETGEVLGHGINKTVRYLADNPRMYEAIQAEVRGLL